MTRFIQRPLFRATPIGLSLVLSLASSDLTSAGSLNEPNALTMAQANSVSGSPAAKAPDIKADPAPQAAVPLGTPATIIEGKQAESLLGKQAQNQKGEDMGRIVDVIVDKTGQIRAAVIDFGGFLGVGSRKIAVDWRAIRSALSDASDKILVDMPQDQLRTAPVYKEGEPVVVVGTANVAAQPAVAPPAAAAKTTP